MARRVRENPLRLPHFHAPKNAARTALTLAVLAGGAYLVYLGLKSPASSAPTGSLGPGAPTLNATPGGSLSIPATGAYVALPAEPTWSTALPAPYAGTSTPLIVQPPSGSTGSTPIPWVDAKGAAQTTTLVG